MAVNQSSANSLREVNELIAYIDGIMATIENYPMFNLETPFLNKGIGVNVMGLLVSLLEKFFSEDELIDVLVNMLIKVLPAMELAVKGVILSQLKLSTSCNVDPFIPDEWRQHNLPSMDNYVDNTRSFNATVIPANAIDLWGMFMVNPTTSFGKKHYAKSSIQYKYAGIDERFLKIDNTEWMSESDKKLLKRQIEAKYINDSYTVIHDILNAELGALFKPEDIVDAGDITTPYQLVRADDMNSFLWFVMHRGLFSDNNVIRTKLTTYDDATEKFAVAYATSKMQFPQDDGYIDLDVDDTQNQKEIYLPGDIVSTKWGEDGVNSTNYLMCVTGEKTYTTKSIEHEDLSNPSVDEPTYITEDIEGVWYKSNLWPCSDRTNSYIWYMTPGNIFTRGFKDGTEEEDKAFNTCQRGLCSISYTNMKGNVSRTIEPNGCFNVKVLPKPLIHYRKGFWIAKTTGADIPFVGKKILFNSEGKPIAWDKEFNPKKKGYFTVRAECDENGKLINPYKYPLGKDADDWCYYNLLDNNGQLSDFVLHIEDDQNYWICKKKDALNPEVSGMPDLDEPLKFDENDVDKLEFINSCLFPCYPGLTIYEFNWDFVMNTRIFYPEVVARRLLDRLLTFNLSVNGSLSMEETMYQMRVSEIVENLMNNETGEIKDCFFEFSNDKFTTMLQDAEKKRANDYSFENDAINSVKVDPSDVLSILDSYDDTAILHEQTEVLTQSFKQASVSITNEVLPEDRLNIGKNFIIEALKTFGIICFETLLSPKWLLLLEVNRRMSMSEENVSIEEYIKNFDIKETILKFSALITSIIAEVMKTIIEELTTIAMKKIMELVEKLSSMLILEQITAYKALIFKIIEACSFSFPLFGHRSDLDNTLDVVKYADIDPVDKPKTEEC